MSVFSGNFTKIIPHVPLDRVALGVFLVLAIGTQARAGLRLRAIHWVLLGQIVWISSSAALSGTIAQWASFFALVDQVVVPSVLFTVAATAFSSSAARFLLLKWVTASSIYVGFVSVAQSLGLGALVFPKYIASQAIAGEITRAVGPSLQVASNGAMLTMAMGPVILLMISTKSTLWRLAGAVALSLCALGAFLTLTRSVWIAAVAALLAWAILNRRVRQFVLVGVAAGAVVFALLIQLVPTLSDAVTQRASTVRSLDDRSTTNLAAIKMFDSHPVAGVGWGRFLDNVDWFVWQQDLVPLTTTHILAHNVFLSRAAELGIVGLLLFCVTLWLGPLRSIALAWVAGQREWATVLISVLVAWTCIAMLTPMGYTYPNYLLWLLSGLLSADAIRGWRHSGSGRRRAHLHSIAIRTSNS